MRTLGVVYWDIATSNDTKLSPKTGKFFLVAPKTRADKFALFLCKNFREEMLFKSCFGA